MQLVLCNCVGAGYMVGLVMVPIRCWRSCRCLSSCWYQVLALMLDWCCGGAGVGIVVTVVGVGFFFMVFDVVL